MNKDAILKKLRKLRERAFADKSEEATHAQIIIEQLLKKYNLSEDDIEEEPTKRPFVYGKGVGLRDAMIGLCCHLDVKVYRTNKRFHVVIEATDTEWALFTEFWKDILDRYDKKFEELQVTLRSFIAGYVNTQYPSEDPKCPECGGDISFSFRLTKYVCHECGWKSRRVQVTPTDCEAYAEG